MNLLVCQRTDSCRDVAQRMRDGSVGLLPVLDGGNVVGVVTDRDLALRYLTLPEGQAPPTTVEGCMTSRVISVDPSATVEESVRLMRDHGIRRLLVMDGSTLTGVVTLDDIFVAGLHRPDVGSVVAEALRGTREPNRG